MSIPLGVLIVPPMFNGPPRSANGGYLAGMMAAALPAPAATTAVTLRRPPSLAEPMLLSPVPGGGVQLHRGEGLIAEATPSRLAALDVPPPVTFEAAKQAERGFPGHEKHAFPSCFVCGPARAGRSGMRLFPGAIPGTPSLVACPWVPDPALAEPGSRRVRTEFVWAALDCPGAWTIDLDKRAVVLGRITGQVESAPDVGESCVVTARLDRCEGRKFYTCTAVYGSSGRLHGRAESVWIELHSRPSS